MILFVQQISQRFEWELRQGHARNWSPVPSFGKHGNRLYSNSALPFAYQIISCVAWHLRLQWCLKRSLDSYVFKVIEFISCYACYSHRDYIGSPSPTSTADRHANKKEQCRDNFIVKSHTLNFNQSQCLQLDIREQIDRKLILPSALTFNSMPSRRSAYQEDVAIILLTPPWLTSTQQTYHIPQLNVGIRFHSYFETLMCNQGWHLLHLQAATTAFFDTSV